MPLLQLTQAQGRTDSGYNTLIDRMSDSKRTNEEIRLFYKERAAIEDEYAKKLTKLSKVPMGDAELGTIQASIEVLKRETASMAEAHAKTANLLRTDLEEPHTTLSNSIRERRKLVRDKDWLSLELIKRSGPKYCGEALQIEDFTRE